MTAAQTTLRTVGSGSRLKSGWAAQVTNWMRLRVAMVRSKVPSTSVLLTDRQEITRRGLRQALERSEAFQVVGEAATARAGVLQARRSRPDIVVMGSRFPDGWGADACRKILAAVPTTKVVFLTAVADEQSVLAAVLAGASGYLLKDRDPDQVVDDLLSVASGESVLDPRLVPKVLEQVRRPDGPLVEPLWTLSPMHRRVAELIGDGLTSREIASRLSLAEGTVKNYSTVIYRKLGVRSRSDVARLVAEYRAAER